MSYGVPVVCANTSSLPELVGDAALTFPPTDVSALSDALRRVLADASLRAELAARGAEQVKRFSWDNTARAILDVLIEAAR
jgi:glycosyltransferase involved in cell wall biosynthesis